MHNRVFSFLHLGGLPNKEFVCAPNKVAWQPAGMGSADHGMLEGVSPGLETCPPSPETCPPPLESFHPPPETCPPPPYRLSLSLPTLAPSPDRWEEVARKRRQRRARWNCSRDPPISSTMITRVIMSRTTAVQTDLNYHIWFFIQIPRCT